jgi:signal transduction histidine kinase
VATIRRLDGDQSGAPTSRPHAVMRRRSDPSGATVVDRRLAAIWSFCSEALANGACHSGATAAEIDAIAAAASVVIEVSDDGRGGATLERGLRGLSDRAEALGGVLTVDSPTGGSTAIRLELPVRSPAGS